MPKKSESGQQKILDSFARDESQEEKDRVIIYADDREDKLISILREEEEVKVRVKRLEVSDFILSEAVAVERKTTRDFINSIIDKRLFEQLQVLEADFAKPLTIIEGNSLYGHREVHPNAIRGALFSVLLDYEVPILWSKSPDNTSDLLVSLAKREQFERERQVSIRGKKPSKDLSELQEFLICGLPHISSVMSQKIFEHFDSPKEFFCASEKELKEVEGIGDKKAKIIREIVDSDYEGGDREDEPATDSRQ